MSRARFLALLACFALSGFAALLYETVWTREFAFVFGTSELAVAAVLAAYMGGLAAGSAIAARYLGRVTHPVRTYGVLELAIAASAVAVPLAIQLTLDLARTLFGGRDAPPPAGGFGIGAFYLAASFLILLVPTALMGTTLPVLLRRAIAREDEIGSRVGTLYAVNTFGAVAGTLTAAFVLLPAFGLSRTVWIGAGVNALVFALAIAIGRAGDDARRADDTRELAPAIGRRWLLLPILLASGAASFAYEVLWTRLLGHLLGASVYAFATMLATFLFGIALGSSVAARLAKSSSRAFTGLAAAQIAIAVLSCAAFAALDALPTMAARLGAGTKGGLASNVALCALLLLPSALAIGTTFPFAVRALAHDERDAARASARLYAWNTFGAIAGAVGTGWFLLPWLGHEDTLRVAAATNLALAIATAWLAPARRAPVAIAATALFAALVLVPMPIPWRVLHFTPLNPGRLEREGVDLEKIAYFSVGRSTTVLLLEENEGWRLRTNGLPEAKIAPAGVLPRELSDRWLTALPVLARPSTRSMLVIGLGGGCAVESVPRTVESIHVLELEHEVVEANEAISDRRAADPLRDPRVEVIVNDGRGALELTARRYDAIVSQPSHPWTAGASHLYTREFFELARDHLNDGGIFLQWVGAQFVDEALLRSLLATMHAVFPHVRVYRPFPRAAILFLGSSRALPVEDSCVAAIAAAPADFASIGVQRAEDVACALALDEETARAFAQGAQLVTDDRNLLQMRAPDVMRTGQGPAELDAWFAQSDPLPRRAAAGWRTTYLVRRLCDQGANARAARYVQAVTDPAERAVGDALGLGLSGRRAEALARAAAAADGQNPHRDARALHALELARAASPDAERVAATLPDAERAVFQGLALASRGEIAAVAELDPLLATIARDDVLYDTSVRLRVRWRVAGADPARAQEALAILDAMLPFFGGDADWILRANALERAGRPSEALDQLLQAVAVPSPGVRAAKAEAREVLRRVPASGALARRRADVEKRLAEL